MHAYANSEREAAVESDNPHALIAVMFDELLRSDSLAEIRDAWRMTGSQNAVQASGTPQAAAQTGAS